MSEIAGRHPETSESSLSPGPPEQRRPSPFALILTGLLLAVCLALVGLGLRSDASRHDFISFWSSARLAVEHGNPYDPAAIWRIERAAGSDVTRPFVMRNPPWALPLVYLLGWFSVPVAGTLWTVAILVATVLAMRALRDRTSPAIALNLWFFAPILLCVAAGQTGTFLLLGIALFMSLSERRPFLAGCALLLPAMKPHLFLLFWPVWLIGCVLRRDFRACAGLGVALAAATGCALVIDPHVFSHYVAMMSREHATDQFLPNISCALRLMHPGARWLEALPTLGALPFVIATGWRRRAWNWKHQGAIVVAASVFTAPYCWPTDQVLFLPMLMMLWRRASRPAVLIFTVLNLATLVLAWRDQNLSVRAYLWTSPAWILWCVWVALRSSAPEAPASAADQEVSAAV